MKVIGAGGRDYDNEKEVDRIMAELHEKYYFDVVITGAQRKWDKKKNKYVGADWQIEEWTRMNEVPYYGRPARWSVSGNKAGPIRNEANAKVADAVILFPGGRGTDSMRKFAKQYGLKILYDAGNK